VAEARIIDYYSILSVPPTADLVGISNAYARLSDQLAVNAEDDLTVKEAILRLNEAYAVLSRPDARRKYDAVYFSGDRRDAIKHHHRLARRRRWMGNALVGLLLLAVVAQGSVLAYLGREQVSGVANAVFGPLIPGEAG
jgi:hypothetical protein